jgi:hemoglobin/transferrin/lactoferrin receptor protein
VRLQGGIFNLFDRKYWLWSDLRNITNPGASVDRYTQPGRNFAVQLRIDL